MAKNRAERTIRTGALVAAQALLLCHCGKTAETQTADAGAAGDANVTLDGGHDAGTDGRLTDGSAGGDSPFDASPPTVSCVEDASACDTLPVSTCEDSRTVRYYESGSCVGGSCTWKANTMPCGTQSTCVNGGCTPPTTK